MLIKTLLGALKKVLIECSAGIMGAAHFKISHFIYFISTGSYGEFLPVGCMPSDYKGHYHDNPSATLARTYKVAAKYLSAKYD